MTGCRNRKRVQIYLDGWMDESEAARFELHLRGCPECQAELINLEEVASSALEIVDEAPDARYWDSFSNRLFNRIISRNVSPYAGRKETSRTLRLRIGSYVAAITTAAAALLLILSYATRSPRDADSRAGSDQLATVTDTTSRELTVADVGDIRGTTPHESEPGRGLQAEQPSNTTGRESPGLVSESRTAMAGDIVLQQREAANPEIQNEGRFRDEFKDEFRGSRASLALDGDYGFLDRLMSVYDGRKSDNYGLDRETVAEAILSGYEPRVAAGAEAGESAISVNGSIPGVAGRARPELPEMSEKDELTRYMIELQIMRAK
jgi:hypothetical protein